MDDLIPYSAARTRALAHGWREKVLAYITRRPDELLVFDHLNAGIQVPAGGVDPGEVPDAAVVREAFEETGLRLTRPVYLASHEWLTQAPSRIRHYYWLQTPLGTADAWDHTVSAGEEDKGMLFHLSFVPIAEHGLLAGYGFESAVDELVKRLRRE